MNLTATKSTNQREVEMMFGKAMCAYYNWRKAAERPKAFFKSHVGEQERANITAQFEAEYEATVRCIAMFVDESLPNVCKAVIAAAEEKFGI